MFRGSARAFGSDAYAVRLTKEGIERGFHGFLRGAQLDFFFMPLMHSETLSAHDLLAQLGVRRKSVRASASQDYCSIWPLPASKRDARRESTAEEASYLVRSRPSNR